MIKHTPGPWYIEEPNLKKQRVDISTDESCPTTGRSSWRGLARAYGCVDYPESGTAAMMANARLIAAAPELLEALIDLVYQVDRPNQPSWLWLDEARAAIAKATGESQ